MLLAWLVAAGAFTGEMGIMTGCLPGRAPQGTEGSMAGKTASGWTDNVARMEAWAQAHPGAKYHRPLTSDGEHMVTWTRPDGQLVEASDRDLGKLCDYLGRHDHAPAPRDGEVLYRHGVPAGRAGVRELQPYEYPVTCICTCGHTIDRRSADVPWVHREWAQAR